MVWPPVTVLRIADIAISFNSHMRKHSPLFYACTYSHYLNKPRDRHVIARQQLSCISTTCRRLHSRSFLVLKTTLMNVNAISQLFQAFDYGANRRVHSEGTGKLSVESKQPGRAGRRCIGVKAAS